MGSGYLKQVGAAEGVCTAHSDCQCSESGAAGREDVGHEMIEDLGQGPATEAVCAACDDVRLAGAHVRRSLGYEQHQEAPHR